MLNNPTEQIQVQLNENITLTEVWEDWKDFWINLIKETEREETEIKN